MTRVVVVGGGLAGLAASASLGEAGFRVELLEARGFLGGRAASYPLPGSTGEIIDNCQHVLLGSCVNLLDLYRRLEVLGRIRFHDEIPFLEPGGRLSILKPGRLPPPLHFSGSFAGLRFLSAADKLSVSRGLAALWFERRRRGDLDRITMLDWLRQKGQTPRAIERFWRQVLVSAVNEELDRMAAAHGFQVFWLGFLARRDAARIGLPAGPLGELYDSDALRRLARVEIRMRAAVERLLVADGVVRGAAAAGERFEGDYYICAVPFERLPAMIPELGLDLSGWEHSPIIGIHLWFDRPVTALPFAALLDRTMQWLFNKRIAGQPGQYIQLVVSASRGLVETPRAEVIDLAVRELAEFLPAARHARLEKAHVVKEVRATFSARPGMEARRPPARTRFPNLFLAGDWTRSGWPATMEGAVRSGYLAAEAVAAAAGRPQRFLQPDIA